ncbi:hypothetical protein ACHAWX_000134, partial [Stephanocyclus meneghinianus]
LNVGSCLCNIDYSCNFEGDGLDCNNCIPALSPTSSPPSSPSTSPSKLPTASPLTPLNSPTHHHTAIPESALNT